MSATWSDVRGSLLLAVALTRAQVKERFAAMLLSERTKRGHGDPRNYPQPEMARELNVSLRQYQRWEDANDPSMPGTGGLLKVCETLGRDPQEIYDDPEPEAVEEDKFTLIQEALEERATEERAFEKRVEAKLRALEAAIRKGQSPGQSPPALGDRE